MLTPVCRYKHRALSKKHDFAGAGEERGEAIQIQFIVTYRHEQSSK